MGYSCNSTSFTSPEEFVVFDNDYECVLRNALCVSLAFDNDCEHILCIALVHLKNFKITELAS